jgi:molybdopterin molybdotransferase
MDGFAVHSSDLTPDGTATLKLAQTIVAGAPKGSELERGTTARIMTGAPLPDGASRVIMQEDATLFGEDVSLQATLGGKDHIRRVGEDVQEGVLLLKMGTRLHPGHIALLIATGMKTVSVLHEPRVAILSSGDELVDSSETLGDAQIYDTNRPMLVEMLKSTGALVTDLGIAKDDPLTMRSILMAAASTHDLIISSGGASSGIADHLAQIVAEQGRLDFWNLGMRPGKPVGFGEIGGCPILVLPGNPVAAAGGLAIIGRAIINRLRNEPVDLSLPTLPVAAELQKAEGKTHLVMGRLVVNTVTGRTELEPLHNQSSASYHSLAMSEVFLILRPGRTSIDRGDCVEYVRIWDKDLPVAGLT